MSTERESEEVFTYYELESSSEYKLTLRDAINALFREGVSNAIVDSLKRFSVERFVSNPDFPSKDKEVVGKVVSTPFDVGTSMRISGRFLHLYSVESGVYTVLDMHKGFSLVCGDERVIFGSGGMR